METGPDLREEHELADGTRVVLRHIRPEDAPELRRGFERLSPQSRERRFFGGVGSLSDAQLRYLTSVDGQDHVAIVAAARKPGSDEEVGLGVARFIRVAGEPTVAEVAITVVDEAQGKGLGRLLSLTLARAAYERGVRRFRGQILENNPVVRQLLLDVGADIRKDSGEVIFDIELTPTPFAPGSRLDVVARRLLRAAASFLDGRFGRTSGGRGE
jgi:GNAT superfamily N-acetyltransferase